MDFISVATISIVVIAVVSGWIYSHSKEVESPIKVVFFVMTFWGAIFIQLMVFAGLYELGVLDSLMK